MAAFPSRRHTVSSPHLRPSQSHLQTAKSGSVWAAARGLAGRGRGEPGCPPSGRPLRPAVVEVAPGAGRPCLWPESLRGCRVLMSAGRPGSWGAPDAEGLSYAAPGDEVPSSTRRVCPRIRAERKGTPVPACRGLRAASGEAGARPWCPGTPRPGAPYGGSARGWPGSRSPLRGQAPELGADCVSARRPDLRQRRGQQGGRRGSPPLPRTLTSPRRP